MSKVFICGSSMIKIGRNFEKGVKELAHEALLKLYDAVGGDVRVDYVVVSSMLSALQCHQLDLSTILTQYLGLRPTPSVRVEAGESSGMSAIELAYWIIKSGQASRVLVLGVEKMTEYPSSKVNSDYSKILDYDVEYLRNITPPNYAALIMKEYMRRYGIKREDLASWPVKMHENALGNPYAQLRFRISRDDVIKSQIISDPVTLLDTFPLGDGAAAIMMCSEEGRPAGTDSVELTRISSATAEPLYLREDLIKMPATKEAFKRVSNIINQLNKAAIQVHDSYSIYGLLTIESLGLSQPGRGWEAIESLSYVNFSGGLKARGHPVGATPIYQIAESYELLINEFPQKSFNGELAIIHSMSGPDYNARIAVLRR